MQEISWLDDTPLDVQAGIYSLELVTSGNVHAYY